jgi:hypothetical protein
MMYRCENVEIFLLWGSMGIGLLTLSSDEIC